LTTRRDEAIHLHPSGDPFLYYLVLVPRPGVVEKIILGDEMSDPATPLITGITCETDARADTLEDLPDSRPGNEEDTWIEAHAISSTSPRMEDITAEIRRAHRL